MLLCLYLWAHNDLSEPQVGSCTENLQSFSFVASGLRKMSPVPLLKDSRGSSFGLSGLLGHSFVIMTSDLCRPMCWEECRRCLPSLRLMVSRWLLLAPFFPLWCVFPEPGPLLLALHALKDQCCKKYSYLSKRRDTSLKKKYS